jgi:hypothetical protein
MSIIQASLAGNISFPNNSVIPSISGTASAGNTLTANPGTWYGTAPISYTYQWNQNGNVIAGATNSTYLLDRSYLGATITVTVTASNPVGSSSAVTSSATSAVTGAPVNTVGATISGSAAYGSTVTINPGTWTGYPTPTYTYQWYSTNTGNVGTGATTYTIPASDVGYKLTVFVTANNGVGGGVQINSAFTDFITRPAYVSSGSATITGTAYIGNTLHVDPPVFGGYPNPSVTYQWYNSSTGIIAGETNFDYVLRASDNLTTVYAIVSGTNSGGTATSTSAATATVTYPPIYADLLVVGGGGGGGGANGGAGGGAGGVIYQPISTNCIARNTSYGITVGGGGAGGGPPGATVYGSNGSNSCFGASRIACGGGGAGTCCGVPGGSGGGFKGLYFLSSLKCPFNCYPVRGQGTPGQGNDGGLGMGPVPCWPPAVCNGLYYIAPGGGGGGGAGGAGQPGNLTCNNPSTGSPSAIFDRGGCGGSAVNYSVTGTPCDYGGGGGGASFSTFTSAPCYAAYKLTGGQGGGQSGGQGARFFCNWACPATCGSEPYLGKVPATPGIACSGGGGGGNSTSCAIPGNIQCGGNSGCSGGPGVVQLAWCTSPAITYAISGVTYCADTTTRSGYTVLNITGGSGTICFGP